MKKIIIASLVALMFPVLAHQADMCPCTSSPTVTNYDHLLQLSELLPNPEGDDTKLEFIELENISTKTVSLDGWVLQDASNKKYTIEDGDIPKGGFLSIERTVSGISLNNSGTETISLISPDGKTQDTVIYSEGVKEGYSYARNGSTWAWTQTPTKNAKNVITLPNDPPTIEFNVQKTGNANSEIAFEAEADDPDGDTVTITWSFGDGVTAKGATVNHVYKKSGEMEGVVTADDGRGGVTTEEFTITIQSYDVAVNVKINEVYPKPDEGQEEWIEIANFEGRDVELFGWSVTDGVRTFTFDDAVLLNNGFYVLLKSESGIALNDTGDTVALLRPDASESDTVTYSSAQKGKSYVRIADSWAWGNPTKGEPNQTPSEGLVLGTMTQAAELPTTQTSESATILQDRSFMKRYGTIVFLSALGVGVFAILYLRWKKQKQSEEELEILD